MNLREDMKPDRACFGDGAKGAADFRDAMKFAGVFRAQTVFLCNNNQWAISVPVSKQTASATLAEKANAYGFDGVRVDGMDALAVYRATREAAHRAKDGLGPTLVEAVTYRIGPHSSSDDPSRDRDEAEGAAWQARDPPPRFRRYLAPSGWGDDPDEARLAPEIGGGISRGVPGGGPSPP